MLIDEKERVSLEIGIFKSFRNIVARISTRRNGVSTGDFATLNLGYSVGDDSGAVNCNRERFLNSAGIGTESLAQLKQVHGTTIYHAIQPGFYGEGDGFITDRPGVFLAVRTADCIPVFLYEPRAGAIALLHAGRRGVHAGIILQALAKMADEFSCDLREVIAALGPHIRSCCYAVGNEVAAQFPEDSVRKSDDGALYLDLAAAAAGQLMDAGISDSHIECTEFCTSCNEELFYSHRRDKGRTGRMMAVFGRK